MPHTSVYRTLNRLPQSDVQVHYVADRILGPGRCEPQAVPLAPKHDWTGQRQAKPAENLLPATAHWLATLPLEIQPTAIGTAFPRITNVLAVLWTRAEALMSYLDDLLLDKRGGRRGFPFAVLEELHALSAYYARLHPERSGHCLVSAAVRIATDNRPAKPAKNSP